MNNGGISDLREKNRDSIEAGRIIEGDGKFTSGP